MSKRHPWGSTELLSGINYTLALTKRQYMDACKVLNVSVTDWIDIEHGATLFYGHACIVVLKNRRGLTENEIKSTLTHEAVHVWQFNKERIEEKGAGNEVEAYAIEKIAFELFELYDKLS